MPTFKSFDAYRRELERMWDKLDREEKRKITRDQAERAQKIATEEARRDVGGDLKFSGWAPLLETQIKTKPNGVTALMPTRSGAGPWTVAQFGRNQGNASGFSGPGINRRTGITSRTRAGNLRRVRAVRARRWNGTTRGKGTADRAIARMEKELPKIADVGVRKVMRKHFDVT